MHDLTVLFTLPSLRTLSVVNAHICEEENWSDEARMGVALPETNMNDPGAHSQEAWNFFCLDIDIHRTLPNLA